VQVDPLKPKLKAPETKLLKLKCGKLLSSFGFNFNLRRYIPCYGFGDATTKDDKVFSFIEVGPG
jgi:hypothetical protein